MNLVLFCFHHNDHIPSTSRYSRVMAMKQKNPKLKILLAIGGWNMASAPFTKMVATAAGRKEFCMDSVSFLKKRGFDGLDLDWEYPTQRGSPPEDRQRFASLVEVRRHPPLCHLQRLYPPTSMFVAGVQADLRERASADGSGSGWWKDRG